MKKQSLFNQFPNDGHLDCFWFFVNSTAMDNFVIHIYVFIFLPLYIWDRLLDVELQGQRVNEYTVL